MMQTEYGSGWHLLRRLSSGKPWLVQRSQHIPSGEGLMGKLSRETEQEAPKKESCV